MTSYTIASIVKHTYPVGLYVLVVPSLLSLILSHFSNRKRIEWHARLMWKIFKMSFSFAMFYVCISFLAHIHHRQPSHNIITTINAFCCCCCFCSNDVVFTIPPPHAVDMNRHNDMKYNRYRTIRLKIVPNTLDYVIEYTQNMDGIHERCIGLPLHLQLTTLHLSLRKRRTGQICANTELVTGVRTKDIRTHIYIYIGE